jgi:ABC-2 type transport system permease protein
MRARSKTYSCRSPAATSARDRGHAVTGEPPRRGTYPPILELTLARLREFVREPEALFWTFFFPIVMSVAMAIAFPAGGAQTVRVGIAAGPGSDALTQSLSSAKDIVVKDVPPHDQLRALRNGEVHLIVEPGNPPTYRFDPMRDESRLARLVVDGVLKGAAGRQEPWRAREDLIAIPGSRYVDWLIPGIISLGIMNNGLWSIGFMTVQARLRKLLKRLAASPMRRSDYLMAPVLARLVFLGPEVAVPLVFGAVAFGMPIRGGLTSIALVAIFGALMWGALGLLMGSRARTFEAASGLMNMMSVPMWVLSGVFFAASNFPDAVQPFIQLLPLTALVDALRAVVLEGASLAAIWNELAIMAGWTIVPFAIALKIFRWR